MAQKSNAELSAAAQSGGVRVQLVFTNQRSGRFSSDPVPLPQLGLFADGLLQDLVVSLQQHVVLHLQLLQL